VRDIEEIRFELGEIAGDLRNARARLIRLGSELDRDHVSKAEARRRMTGNTSPDIPSYLLECLELLEEEDLKNAEQTLRQAAELSEAELAKIWAERGETTET